MFSKTILVGKSLQGMMKNLYLGFYACIILSLIRTNGQDTLLLPRLLVTIKHRDSSCQPWHICVTEATVFLTPHPAFDPLAASLNLGQEMAVEFGKNIARLPFSRATTSPLYI